MALYSTVGSLFEHETPTPCAQADHCALEATLAAKYLELGGFGAFWQRVTFGTEL
jgi:hypothetical protein